MPAESSPAGAVNFRRPFPGLYRAGNLSFLSEQGKAELLSLGLSRIIDLRSRTERLKDAPPFSGSTEYLNLPLLPWRMRAMNEVTAAARTNADLYRTHLDHAANHIVTIMGAILDAPTSPVLVHCHAGKDRTGLIVALCGELAGQSREAIAEDYAASEAELVAFYVAQRQRHTQERWAAIEPFMPTRAEDILAALDYLDEKWGGVGPYLVAYGFSEAEQAALAERLTSVEPRKALGDDQGEEESQSKTL